MIKRLAKELRDHFKNFIDVEEGLFSLGKQNLPQVSKMEEPHNSYSGSDSFSSEELIQNRPHEIIEEDSSSEDNGTLISSPLTY